MAEQDDGFGLLLFGKSDGRLDAGKDAYRRISSRSGGSIVHGRRGCIAGCIRRRIGRSCVRVFVGRGVGSICRRAGWGGSVDGNGRHCRGQLWQIRQGQAEAAPTCVRQFATQWADSLGPICTFPAGRQQNHHASRFADIGRFPQGEKGLVAGLQLLLLVLWQLALQGAGRFDAALFQSRALCRRNIGGWRCGVCRRGRCLVGWWRCHRGFFGLCGIGEE